MKILKDLMYSKSHEWVKFQSEDSATIGITDYAQDSLGDIVFINLPDEGDSLVVDESFGDIESVKAVSDLLSPISGEVSQINELLLDEAERINEEPYESWMVKVIGITGKEALMDADAYEKFCAEEA